MRGEAPRGEVQRSSDRRRRSWALALDLPGNGAELGILRVPALGTASGGGGTNRGRVSLNPAPASAVVTACRGGGMHRGALGFSLEPLTLAIAAECCGAAL